MGDKGGAQPVLAPILLRGYSGGAGFHQEIPRPFSKLNRQTITRILGKIAGVGSRVTCARLWRPGRAGQFRVIIS
ncbi:TPA: hypothetical protein DDY55_04415 [Candidatus Falkowbacteria bacterium]|nr:hypothetical protein [Candidatus Falkowbacteria bacterium]HAY12170.1 hypothetical protein [Candidatus Falkowbacteria bacterium]HBI97331.1 hypothetical protein [Candidatus Falkowbacteria bacterium]HBT28074.1 hypothetical protein [Candidatus Falkowbacteria bacterium]HBY14538.1 hypothetical protein [Candidatus Falkowbacteria bacterium]